MIAGGRHIFKCVVVGESKWPNGRHQTSLSSLQALKLHVRNADLVVYIPRNKRERERERERERGRRREREKEREADRERHRERVRQTDRQTDRQTGRQTERERERQRQRDRKTDRQTGRQTEREREYVNPRRESLRSCWIKCSPECAIDVNPRLLALKE